MRYTLTLQARHEEHLRELVLPGDGREGVAYLLCRSARIAHDPWTGVPELRLISRNIVPVDAGDVYERDVDHVSWRSDTLHRLLPRCQSEGLVVVLVHSHPRDVPDLSKTDTQTEPVLFDYGWVRDGDDIPFASIVMTDTTIRGRVWYGWSKDPFVLDVVRVVGERFQFHRTFSAERNSAVFARQILAFGPALDKELAALRVVVVGGGGTGSATATLLARLGVGRVAIIDPDLVETTNLNRLHGASQADADGGRTKVDVLVSSIARAGLGVAVRGFARYVDDPQCHDVLLSADVVFGCTDDHAGRLFINRLAYFYAIPVIDMGLMMQVDDTNPDNPRLQHLAGRITVLAPGLTCIACRDVTDSNAARDELLRRQQPGQYARLKAEAYVTGEGNPRPAVVTFTTEVATMAVNEMLQRLSNFRGTSRDHRLHDFLDESDMSFPPQSRAGCKCCDTQAYCGKADVSPFLGLAT